jgi:2-polyprenyl-6-methoxyphenol hydroxylase-like FAD-dependent oxidoreductase
MRMPYALPMTQPTVLISGAGIAGPALAHWLTSYRYRVVIVELASGIRPGGQTVDLRGAGRGVVERMGLLHEMTQRSLDQRGIAWVLAILRGDLVDVLYQATKDCAEYRFNTRITALDQRSEGVDATLTDGTHVHADLVVGADGPHSAVRQLAFGPEDQFVKPLGGYHAWFTAPDTVGLDGWPFRSLAAKKWFTTAESIDLPDYTGSPAR